MADTHSRTVSLPGGRVIGLAEYGDPQGVPVLALHGAPACRLMFAMAHGAARAAGLRLIAPDRPGYGLTPPDNASTLAGRTEWFERVADMLELERFALFAISGGGPYAVALAAHLKTRVTALGLVSPMGPVADFVSSQGYAAAPLPFLKRRFFLHLPRRAVFPPMAHLAARIFMAMPNGFGGALPMLANDPDAKILRQPHVRQSMLAMTREAVRSGATGGIHDLKIFGRPWGVDYSAITAPAILWQGTADRVVPVSASHYLARMIPNCQLREIHGGGHFWIFEAFDRTLIGLRAAIAGLNGSALP